MRSGLMIVAAIIVVSVAGSALAKDLCIQDQAAGHYVFQKVKAPKKAGKGTALHGYYKAFGSDDIYPMSGSAVVASDGTVWAAVTVYDVVNGAVHFVLGWTADATLAGTGNFDNNGDGLSDGAITFLPVDCRTVTLP